MLARDKTRGTLGSPARGLVMHRPAVATTEGLAGSSISIFSSSIDSGF